MHNCLAIDVAKGKSMVTLISSCGEVLIEPRIILVSKLMKLQIIDLLVLIFLLIFIKNK